MKKGMPLVYLAGLCLLVFFLYALLNLGHDLGDTITANRNTIGRALDAGIGFVSNNKTMLAFAAAVLVLARIFGSFPGPARL